MSTRVSNKLVPVYRKHQPTMVSPCVMGKLCPTCALHAPCRSGEQCRACRRGKSYQCELAAPAEPAFRLKIHEAVSLVKDGLASFINRNTAVQLTFSRLAHLRDQSCKIDERTLMEYVSGSRRARAAVNLGWGQPLAIVTVDRDAMDKLAERIQNFG